MKNNKKSLLLIALLLVVVVTSCFGVYTYAKYISGASSSGKADVAKWVVKVNDTDITPAGVTTLGDVDLTTVDNANVVDGKIAPASEAYGVFTIDPTGSEVAVGYKFSLGTITTSSVTIPTGLAVNKVEYCTGTTCDATSASGWTAITPNGSLYEGTIDLPSGAAMTNAQKVNVRVTIKWTDDETTSPDADDTNHTAAGVTGATLTIPVTTTVFQKVA